MRSTPTIQRAANGQPSARITWRGALPLAFALCLALGQLWTFIAAPTVSANAPHIDVTAFQRNVDPAGARAIADAIDTAEHDGATLLVITIDTPGGDINSMQKIVQSELAATVPIATYVSPQGGQAASAGSFVTLAAPIAAMAPSTRIGAASPIDSAGNDLQPTLKAKVEQDLEALMRSIQTDYHRAVPPAESMITNATAYTDDEAKSQNIVSMQAPSLTALISQLDGYTGAYATGAPFTVQTSGLPVVTLQPSFANDLEAFLFDPTVLFVIFMVAATCIYLELAHPGAIIPGVIGAFTLIVFIVGSLGINPNWGGLALMILAILLLGVDTRAPTHGVLTLGALVSLIVGAVIYFDTGSNPGAPGVNLSVIIGVAAGLGLIALLVLRYSVGAQLRRVTTGKESYVGQVVTVIEPLAPTGRVSLLGENWSAKLSPKAATDTALPIGARARIVRVEGLTLLVEPTPNNL